MHVLIAEDNEFEQKVVQHQLKMLGHSADAAINGHEALKYWLTGKYDLLFTNLHMPQMDGQKLTNRIRKAEQQTGQHIPIIVFTAGNMESGIQLYPETGFDDFISKPIALNDLQQILEKWRPKDKDLLQEHVDKNLRVKDHPARSKPEDQLVEDATILVNSTHIKELIEQFGQNGFSDLLSALLEDTPPRFKALREAMEQNDFKAIHDCAHALASGFAFMGLSALHQHIRDISEASRSGLIENAHDWVTVIEATYAQTVDLLQMNDST